MTDATSATGDPLAWTEYQPFGAVRSSGASAGAPAVPFAYAGQYRDPTGLYDMRARAYDPITGRFLSVDPVAGSASDPAGSSYVYVRNNPAVWVDPSGRCLGPFVVVCIGAAAGVIGYFGATVATNIVTGHGDDPLRGANPVDVAISGIAGGLSGGIGGLVEGTIDRIAMNAIIGFDASLVSMAARGCGSGAELLIGTVVGGVGGVHIGGTEAAQCVARRVASDAGANTVLTLVQNLLGQGTTATGAGCPSGTSSNSK